MPLNSSRYPKMLSPFERGRLRLRNRIIHAAMTTRRVRDCAPTDSMIQYYANRAGGGAALIVSEPLNCARHQTRAHYVRVWNSDFEEGLNRWAAAVESQDCRLLGQIQDPGRGRHERGRSSNAVGVSPLPDDLSWTVPYVLEDSDIAQLIDDFAHSAARLERCGFSGVEISAGHGHLFHQFLSPWSNHRKDRWGGDFEGRLRFLMQTLQAIRAATAEAFIVGLKLPGDDGIAGGINPVAASRIAKRLTASGQVDYLSFCQGSHARTLDWHIPDMHWPRSTWMPLITDLRQTLPGLPVAALGLITDPAQAEGILARDEADLIALGRALLTDPAWPIKASQGREGDIRYCVSCNSCWGQIVEGQPLACDNNPRVAQPDEVDWRPPPARFRRRVAVIGAGVAGLEAAWVAASRGHEVIVFGATAEVGGKTRLHARLPGGESLSSIYDFQFVQARRAGVRFELGHRASVSDIQVERPDHVILATGAEMSWPAVLPIVWQRDEIVRDVRSVASELIELRTPQGGTAVLFDADHTEGTYAVAELLRRLFDRVVIVTPRERIAVDVPLVTSLGIYRRLALAQIEIVTLHELAPDSVLEEGVVALRNVYTQVLQHITGVVLLTYSTPRQPRDLLLTQLRLGGLTIQRVGDCRMPRNLMAATTEGHAAGLEFDVKSFERGL